MRRKDREITDPAKIAAIMARCEVLHLGLFDQGAPYVLPVSFGMEPDGWTLYIHGAVTGKKYDLLARNPAVGFAMDRTDGLVLEKGMCSVNYESVLGRGELVELTDQAEKRHALDRIMAHYRAEDFPYSTAPMDHTRVFRLDIRERTAKRRGGEQC